MAKTKKRAKKTSRQELDSSFILKLVLYVIIGAQWLWLVPSSGGSQIPVPVGVLIGTFFAWHDHFQIDRKIEYAVLLTAMLFGYIAQAGVYLTI